MTRPLALALILAPLAVGLGVQDPPDDAPKRATDIFGRVNSKNDVALVEAMQGCWQLMELAADGYPEEGLSATAYLVVSERFLALELHASYGSRRRETDRNNTGLEDGFQSFVCEFAPLPNNRIECATLMGAYLDEELDNLQWESGGTREFGVLVDGGVLILQWGTGDSMTFGRRRAGLVRKDTFFGVPDLNGGKAGDLYGKPEEDKDKRREGGR